MALAVLAAISLLVAIFLALSGKPDALASALIVIVVLLFISLIRRYWPNA